MNGSLSPSTDDPGLPGPLSRVLATHSLQYGLAGSLGKVVALLAVPYLTRTLSPHGYGLADLATSLSALLTLVAMFGGDLAAARLRSRVTNAAERRTILTMYVLAVAGASTVLAVSLAPFSAPLAGTLWTSTEDSPLFALALVLVPLSAAQSALVHIQRLELRPGAFAGLAVLDLIAQVVLAVLLVALGFGPYGVVLGFIAGSAIGLAAAAWAARPFVGRPFDASVAAQLVRDGLSFLPATALFVVADYAVRAMLANAAGEDAVGNYAVAVRIASVLTLATYGFSMVWGSYGFALSPGGATSRAAMSWYLTLALGLGGALAVMSPEAVLVAAGVEYTAAVHMIPGLLAAAGIAGGYFVLVVAAGSANRARFVLLSALVGAVIQSALAAGLVASLGVEAVGLAPVAGQLAAFVVLGMSLPAVSRPALLLAVVPVVSVPLVAGLTWAPLDGIPIVIRAGVAIVILGATALLLLSAKRWQPEPPRQQS